MTIPNSLVLGLGATISSLMTTAPGEVPAQAITATSIAIVILIAAGPVRARTPQRFTFAFIVIISTSRLCRF
jgi:hypothetical protein